jgi:hypothetical protein
MADYLVELHEAVEVSYIEFDFEIKVERLSYTSKEMARNV